MPEYRDIVGPSSSALGGDFKQFNSIAEFQAAGGAAANPGSVVISGKQGISDGKKYVELQSGETLTVANGDIAPILDVALTNLAANVVRSGLTSGNSAAINKDNGTRLEWSAGANVTDPQYVGVFYEFTTPFDFSTTDRFMFEFLHDFNIKGTRLEIFVTSAQDLNGYKKFTYSSRPKKPEAEALVVLKSDFVAGGTDANWTSIKRIYFRLTKHASLNPNQAHGMEIRRMTFGAKTRPMIVYSHDDNAVQLYNTFVRNKHLNMPADIFVTDFEIPGEDNFKSATKCSLAQNKEMAEAGYRFYPHNIDHRPFAQALTLYSRTGDAVTLTTTSYAGYSEENAQNLGQSLPSIGQTVTIEESAASQLNGTFTVTGITRGNVGASGGSGSNSTINITVTGASFDNNASDDGATLTVDSYDLVSDIKSLQEKIKQSGLPTNKRYLAYTYGMHSRKIQKALSKECGITLARGLTNDVSPEYLASAQVFQINRKWGMGGQSKRLLGFPCHSLTTASALQTLIDRLLLTGGVLAVMTHGDDISNANHDACLALMAQYRNSGQLDVIQMHQLEAEINARRV